MPYIDAKEVKAIRESIKKTFPQFKFSVTREHGSSVSIHIMSGPVSFSRFSDKDKGSTSINEYRYRDHYKDDPELVELFSAILCLVNNVKDQHEVVYDGDYGSVPNYYVNLNVGKWDRPYKEVN